MNTRDPIKLLKRRPLSTGGNGHQMPVLCGCQRPDVCDKARATKVHKMSLKDKKRKYMATLKT